MSAMTGMAWVRVLIGVLWLLAGLEKVLNQEFPGLFRGVLQAGGVVKDAPPWFQGFMDASVLPNPGLFAALVGAGEVAIGVCLILGFLTNLGAAGSIGMNLGALDIAWRARHRHGARRIGTSPAPSDAYVARPDYTALTGGQGRLDGRGARAP